MGEIHDGLKIDWDELKRLSSQSQHPWLRYAERILSPECVLEAMMYIMYRYKTPATIEEIKEVVIECASTDDTNHTYATLMTLVAISPFVFSAVERMLEEDGTKYIREVKVTTTHEDGSVTASYDS